MRAKIYMDTVKEAETITALASQCDKEVFIEDGNGLKVRAKSIIGNLYALEFEELWLVSEGDYYTIFNDFIVGNPLEAPAAY